MRGTVSVFAAILGSLFALSSNALTLYDGSLNTFPEQQGWFFYAADAPIGNKSVGGGKTSFDSGASTTRAGWSNTIPIINQPVNLAFPSLDRTNGFSLGLDVKVAGESHDTADRAGFDVILLSSDHQGVELGFWNNEVWAQTLSGTSFVHGEGHAIATNSATHYDVGIHGSTYEVFANGASILTGPVRDYSSALAVPYGLNNYLFIGDDTTSATGSIELSSVTIVPEPMNLAIAMLIGATCFWSRRSFV